MTSDADQRRDKGVEHDKEDGQRGADGKLCAQIAPDPPEQQRQQQQCQQIGRLEDDIRVGDVVVQIEAESAGAGPC